MRLSIIRDDNSVVVDGVSAHVDCSTIPSFVRAIQWDGSRGEIEFHRDANDVQPGNMPIISADPYQYLVDAWRVKRAEEAIIEKTIAVEKTEQWANDAKLLKEQEANQLALFQQSMADRALIEADRTAMREKLVELESKHAELSERLVAAERKLADAS